MNQLEIFWDSVKKESTALLATAANGDVTMRMVSPVYYDEGILIFTDASSKKYNQLKANPNCCIEVGRGFMEARAEFLGATMLEKNERFRLAYSEKFADAFSEDVPFGGIKAEFILLKPVKIKGWDFENGIPIGPFEYNFD